MEPAAWVHRIRITETGRGHHFVQNPKHDIEMQQENYFPLPKISPVCAHGALVSQSVPSLCPRCDARMRLVGVWFQRYIIHQKLETRSHKIMFMFLSFFSVSVKVFVSLGKPDIFPYIQQITKIINGYQAKLNGKVQLLNQP